MMTKPTTKYFPPIFGFRDSDPSRGPNYANAYPSLGERGSKLQAEGRARSQSMRLGAWNNYQPVSSTVPQEELMPPKPPMSSVPSGTKGTSGEKPVDENGIPMVLTGGGWVKDPRFYSPEGKVLFFDGPPIGGQATPLPAGNIDPNISWKTKPDPKEQELRQRALSATGISKTRFVYDLADYLWKKNKDMKYYYLTLEEFNVPIPPMYNPKYQRSTGPVGGIPK